MTCALTSIIVPVTARGCSPASGKPGLLADASAAGAWLLDAGSADSPGPGGAPLAAPPGLAAAGPPAAAYPTPAGPGFPLGPAAGASRRGKIAALSSRRRAIRASLAEAPPSAQRSQHAWRSPRSSIDPPLSIEPSTRQ